MQGSSVRPVTTRCRDLNSRRPQMSCRASLRSYLVTNGTRDPSPPSSPQELLLKHAGGSYTVAMLDEQLRIVDWPLHKARIVKNLQVLNASSEGTLYLPLMDWLRKKDLTLSHFIGSHVARLVAEAVRDYSSSSSEKALQHMLMVQVADHHHATADPDSPPVEVMVYLAPNPAPPQGVAVEVVVLGPPRTPAIAASKYSGWVEQRRRLELLQPKSAAEALLMDDEGAIMEGLKTNFFVIAGDASAPALYCPGVADPALAGITATRILAAAEKIGLKIVGQPPRVADRQTWQEAFISNCLRGITPVHTVRCPPENLLAVAPWCLTLPHTYGPWTRRLTTELPSVMELTPYQELMTHAGED